MKSNSRKYHALPHKKGCECRRMDDEGQFSMSRARSITFEVWSFTAMASSVYLVIFIWVVALSTQTECQTTESLLFQGLTTSFPGHTGTIRGVPGVVGSTDSKNDIEIIVPDNYSVHQCPPTDDGGPTEVEFYILLIDVRDIEEVKEELTLEFNLQMYWKDSRLTQWTKNVTMTNRKGYAVLNPNIIKNIWHPDIFIDRVKRIEQPRVISTPASLRVYYRDGKFRYSGRFNMKMACQMVFQYYPADTQRCKIDIKSYSYSNKTLFINWHDGKIPAIKKGVSLPNFAIALGNIEAFHIKTSSSTYTGIRFSIVLRRFLGFHLIQTYLPSCLFVIVSFLTFLVSHESVLECMTLCMTTLLTLTAMFASVKQNTPTVSYIKGLDIWMVTCIFSVFFTLLEHTVLLKLRKRVIGLPVSSPKVKKKRRRLRSREKDTREPIRNPEGRRGSMFNLNMLGKRDKEPKLPSRESKEPLTPYYHKCTNKCKSCSSGSGSCSGDDSLTTVQIRRSSSISNNNGRPSPPPPPARPNILPVQTLNSLSPILPIALRSSSISINNPAAYFASNLTPSDTHLLHSALTMTPNDCKRFKYSQTMELLCSKLIPVSFLIFNIIYWPWLLTSADYYNMKEFLSTAYVD